MPRGRVTAESGVRGARFGAAWTERGHRWLLGKAGQSQGLPVVRPKPEKEGSALQSSGDPQSEGAGRPPRWLLSVSSEPVLLASQLADSTPLPSPQKPRAQRRQQFLLSLFFIKAQLEQWKF